MAYMNLLDFIFGQKSRGQVRKGQAENDPSRVTHATCFCYDCEYPLDGLKNPQCPECGRNFDPNDFTTFKYKITNCKSCGYQLTGNSSGVCPECGQLFGPKLGEAIQEPGVDKPPKSGGQIQNILKRISPDQNSGDS
jgi:rubrerythrin